MPPPTTVTINTEGDVDWQGADMTNPNQDRNEQIRQAHRDGASLNELAGEFGLSHEWVRKIVRG